MTSNTKPLLYCTLQYHKVKPETRDPRLLRQAQGTQGGQTTTQTVPAIAIGSVFTYPGAGLVSEQASENCPLCSSQ